jgi:CCR4-NOT transcription complex subunit 7/8
MPPIRGFGGGPANIGPFHQPTGFPNSHGAGASQNANPGLGQYMLQQQQQMNVFATNGFGSAGVGVGAGFGGAGAAAATGFGSQNARMSFAHAPNMAHQPHNQAQHDFMSEQVGVRHTTPTHRRIRDVWAHNLADEMALMRDMVRKYPYVSMDTEFPGVVCRPMGKFRGKSDYHYQLLRTNIDLCNLIQIGLAFFDENGNPPPAHVPQSELQDMTVTSRRLIQATGLPLAFQFNFKFDLDTDMFNEKSIETLQTHAGINFDMLKRDGVDPKQFAAMLIPSGLVCFEEVSWIAFHGGYDFGYITKNVLNMALPSDEADFSQLMRKYFPSIFDVKWLMKNAARTNQANQGNGSDPALGEILHKFEAKQSLENLAEIFKIKRFGRPHSAGSDALLTGKVFFHIRDKFYGGVIPKDLMNKVWGLAVPEGLFTPGAMGNGQEATGADGGAKATAGASTQDAASGAQASQAASNGGPSTPSNTTASLASGTPAQQQMHNTNGGAMGGGPMTPGSGVGVFGAFNYVNR